MRKFKNMYFSPNDGGGAADPGGAAAEVAAIDEPKKEDKQADVAGQNDSDKKTQPDKKYSEDDVLKLKSNFDRQLKEQVEAAIADASKKAQMKPDEKAQYEQEQRIKDIERREQESAAKELKINTLDALAQNEIDKYFLDYVIGSDMDNTLERIKGFKPLFDKKVQEQVEIRLVGKTPPAGAAASVDSSVREQFKKALGGVN